MAADSERRSFLVESFEEFHGEMVRLERRALHHRSPAAPAPGDDAEGGATEAWDEAGTAGGGAAVAVAEPAVATAVAERSAPQARATSTGDPAVEPSAMVRRLAAILERQRVRCPTWAARSFEDASYVMASLADEIFLHLPWTGVDAWRDRLLETELFGTWCGGERVFERLDALLRSRDAADRELGRVYLNALALGFQGKYRGDADGPAHLDAYRRRLYGLVTRHDLDSAAVGHHLTPQAYSAVVSRQAEGRLPYLRPWILLLGALVLGWVVVSIGLWWWLTTDLEPLLDLILDAVPVGGS